jgi:bacillithiol biosynthesis cysteine-adding enzyme BshC
MKISYIPFHQAPQLSKMDVAYAGGDAVLRPFYRYEVSLEAFAQVIEDKKKDPDHRAVLVPVLRRQYAALEHIPEVSAQLDRLEDQRTFTVATAHQPCLFTGPLYYIYKAFSTIHLAGKLCEAYPDYHFVPVFVSGAEDHDFDEINKARLYNKTIEWQNEESGAVGGMSTTTLAPALDALRELLGTSEAAQEAFAIIEKAYTSHETYGAATIHLLHSLLGRYGLVVVDSHVADLKKLFIPIMEKELLEQPSQALVQAAHDQLEAAGFSGQAFPREINLFYLRPGLRERIVLEDNLYKVLNTNFVFTRDEILAELHAHPEHFSPNVVMRPLYQETVLPNLAYIGGGGEIAYWLERMDQFRHFGVNFPMLIRRNSLWWIDEAGAKRMQKLGLSPEDLFEDTESLIKRYVSANTDQEISLAEEKEQVKGAFAQILSKALALDSTLEKTVLGEQAKQLNALDVLETKLLRAEKQRQDTSVQQIRSLKDKYFPGNGLQERHDNFLPLYIRHGQDFFDLLRRELDPLRPGFVVVQEGA